MESTLDKKFKLRDEFLELTSDRAIRMAAYTSEEWKRNGGTFLGYGQVYIQDEPPIVELYPCGLLGSAFSTLKPLKNQQDPKQRTINIANYLKLVEGHDYYKWLKSDVNFVKAWNKFQKKKTTPHKGSIALMLPIQSEFADFRFLRLVALNIGFQILADEVGYKPKYPDIKTMDRTKGYVTKLQGNFKNGVKIDNLVHQTQLERLLEQLLLELNRAPRKEKETPTMEKRKCLEAFAMGFMGNFQFISAAILTDLAAMLDWTAEHTTIDRIVKNTKAKNGQLLVEALKSYTAQKS
jgi:hypothetical protein